MYKVSIIMPTYNRANVLERAIDSVLNQTYKDFQLIICDDGSNDSTEALINEKYDSYLLDEKILYFKQNNQGVSKARNEALKRVNSELISYLDSDNIWFEDYLEKMISIFDIVKCNAAYCAINVNDTYNDPIYNDNNFIRNEKYSRKKLLNRNFIDLNIFMHKADLYYQLGGFNQNLKTMVDWDLILRYTKFNKPFFLDQVLAKYWLDESLNNLTYEVNHSEDYKKLKKIHEDEINSIKLKNDIKIKKKQLTTIKNSTRYKLGDAIISGLKPSSDTLLTPFKLYRIFNEAISKRINTNRRINKKSKNLKIKSDFKISIKIATPNWKDFEHWGDFHFALALKKEFFKKGVEADIDVAEEWYEGDDSDIVIVLRGLKEYKPNDNQFNIMWNFSHPDLVKIKEYNNYDLIFTCSEIYTDNLKNKLDVPVKTLLQCTDPDLFYPKKSDKYMHDLLFVGNTRNIFRKIIHDLIPFKHDLGLYGAGWDKFINEIYVSGEYIPNSELNEAYYSSKILLNDHWKDMARNGFISNRIFDGFAAGAFIISDEIEGADEIFKDSLVTYSNRKELIDLIEYYLDNEDERKKIAENGRNVVVKNHTFKNRVETILKFVHENSFI